VVGLAVIRFCGVVGWESGDGVEGDFERRVGKGGCSRLGYDTCGTASSFYDFYT